MLFAFQCLLIQQDKYGICGMLICGCLYLKVGIKIKEDYLIWHL